MDVPQIARDGLVYDLIKWGVLAFLSSSGLAFLGAKVFKKLDGVKDIVFFTITVFLILYGFLFVLSPRTQSPLLAGGIETVVSGSPSDGNKLVLAVISMSVMNSGSMQSIIKGWSVEAKVQGRSYYGTFLVAPPKNFVFRSQNAEPNMPNAIVYHSEDNLINKALSPVQPGGLANGLLYVVFSGIEPDIFKGGVDYTVRFQDVLSNSYDAHIATSAISSNLALTPGLHSELSCPIPQSQKSPPVNASVIPANPPLSPAN